MLKTLEYGTHTEYLEQLTPITALADEFDNPRLASLRLYAWKRSNNIPHPHWKEFIRAAKARGVKLTIKHMLYQCE